jgi:O-antigen ligase
VGKPYLIFVNRWLNILFVPIVCLLILSKIVDAFGKFNLNPVLILLVSIYLIKHLAFERDSYDKLTFGPIGIALLFLLIAETLTYTWSSYKPNSYFALMETMSAFLFYCFAKHNLRGERQYIALAAGMTVVGLFHFVGAIVRFSGTWMKLRALGFSDLTFFKDNLLYGDWIVNSILLLPYPLILLYRFKDRTKWSWLLMPVIVLLSVPIIFSFSRGAYIALPVFVILVNLAVMRCKLIPSKILIRFNCIMLALAILASLPVYKSVYSAAAFFKTRSQTISITSRERIWRQSLELAHKNPFLGVGAYNYALSFMTGAPQDIGKGLVRTPQNTFIGIAVEKGLVGLLAYVSVLAIAIYTAYSKLIRLKDNFNRSVIASLAAALVASIIYLFTYYPPLGNQGTLMLTFFIYAFLDGIQCNLDRQAAHT